MSRESLLPASCKAAMAEAAVTPDAVDPWEKSRFPEVSFSSSIFICKTLRAMEDTGSTVICRRLPSSNCPATWTKSLETSANSFSFTAPVSLMKNRGRAPTRLFLRMAPPSRSMYPWASRMMSTYPKPAGVPSSRNRVSNTTGYSP